MEGWTLAAKIFVPALRHRIDSSFNPTSCREELLASRAFSAAWIAHMAIAELDGVWEGLVENDPVFLSHLWAAAFPGGGPTEIKFLLSPERLLILSPKAWKVLAFNRREDILDHLSLPSSEWQLHSKESEARKKAMSSKSAT